jgi:hypothetical protein
MGAAPGAVFRETSPSHKRLELPIARLGRVWVFEPDKYNHHQSYGIYVGLQQARFCV